MLTVNTNISLSQILTNQVIKNVIKDIGNLPSTFLFQGNSSVSESYKNNFTVTNTASTSSREYPY